MIHSTMIKQTKGLEDAVISPAVSEEAMSIPDKSPQLERAADAKRPSTGMLGVFRVHAAEWGSERASSVVRVLNLIHDGKLWGIIVI